MGCTRIGAGGLHGAGAGVCADQSYGYGRAAGWELGAAGPNGGRSELGCTRIGAGGRSWAPIGAENLQLHGGHKELRAPTQRPPGQESVGRGLPDTESAGARHRDRPTPWPRHRKRYRARHRAPGPDTKSGRRQRERRGPPGPHTETAGERRAPTHRPSGPDTAQGPDLESATPRPTQRALGENRQAAMQKDPDTKSPGP